MLDSIEFERRKDDKARKANVPEPPPIGDGQIIIHSAADIIQRLAARATGQGNAVYRDQLLVVSTALVKRSELGKQKYGTYLRAHNGRNAAIDLLQELLDSIMYSEQCRVECDLFREKYFREEPPAHLQAGAGMLETVIELAARLAGQIESVA